MSTAPIKVGDYVKIKNYNHFTGHIGEVLTVDVMESEALVSIKSKYGRQACSPQRIPLLYLDAVAKPDYGLALREKKRMRIVGANVSMKFQSAVPGDLFYETVAVNRNGPVNETPRVLTFDEVFLDKDGRAKVKFTVVSYQDYDGTNPTVTASADDRYGKFVKLSRSAVAAMKERREQLQSTIDSLNCIISVADKIMSN